MAEHRGSNCGEDMLRKRRDQLIWLKQKGVSSYSIKNPWRMREAKRRAGGWPRRGYRRTNRRTIGSQEPGTNSEIQEMWTGRKRQKKERTDNQERFQFDIREDESLPGKNDILWSNESGRLLGILPSVTWANNNESLITRDLIKTPITFWKGLELLIRKPGIS